jgi:hypothetical protein
VTIVTALILAIIIGKKTIPITITGKTITGKGG